MVEGDVVVVLASVDQAQVLGLSRGVLVVVVDVVLAVVKVLEGVGNLTDVVVLGSYGAGNLENGVLCEKGGQVS